MPPSSGTMKMERVEYIEERSGVFLQDVGEHPQDYIMSITQNVRI
jgi:hypothetical protein